MASLVAAEMGTQALDFAKEHKKGLAIGAAVIVVIVLVVIVAVLVGGFFLVRSIFGYRTRNKIQERYEGPGLNLPNAVNQERKAIVSGAYPIFSINKQPFTYR